MTRDTNTGHESKYSLDRSVMYRPSKVIIEAFVLRIEADYRGIYGAGPPGHLDTTLLATRMAFSRLARSNALYHNLGHTLMASLIGAEIIRGKLYRDGNVSSSEWVHFMVSLLTFALGFTRNLLKADRDSTCVIGEQGETLALPRGATDAMLWPHFTERGKLFVREYYAGHDVLDPELLADNIEYARFPPPTDRNLETDSYPGLTRAAQVIGAIADPDFTLKMMPLWLELKECGMNSALGYTDVTDLRDTYPAFFWQMLHPLIPDGIDCLTYTGTGRLWLSNMHAHVLVHEHEETIVSTMTVGAPDEAT